MKAKKAIALTLVAVLLVAGSVMGTIAWLTQQTPDVVNVFNDSDVEISLTETKGELVEAKRHFDMVPGFTIEKDPKVTVTAGSEDCYVFIKVTEAGGTVTVDQTTYGFDDFIDYAIADGWLPLVDENPKDGWSDNGVYYREVTTSADNQTFSVLADDKVTVKEGVTKEMMNGVKDESNLEPKLTFKAYAIQAYKTNTPATGEDGKFTPAKAWELVED